MNKKGISLAELLAVVVIMGIIAAIAIPLVGNVISNTKEKAIKADIVSYTESLRLLIISKNLKDDNEYQVLAEDAMSDPKIFTYDEAGINDKNRVKNINFTVVGGKLDALTIIMTIDEKERTYNYYANTNEIELIE